MSDFTATVILVLCFYPLLPICLLYTSDAADD